MQKTQMNIRMDADLKRQGDAALAKAGYTPTDAVRVLWAFAATQLAQPSQLKKTLDALVPAGAEQDDSGKKRALAKKGARLYKDALAKYPNGKASCLEEMSFEELRWEATAARLGSDGVQRVGAS